MNTILSKLRMELTDVEEWLEKCILAEEPLFAKVQETEEIWRKIPFYQIKPRLNAKREYKSALDSWIINGEMIIHAKQKARDLATRVLAQTPDKLNK